jgi:hypothetical protein
MPPYWINMGAMEISTLAGTLLLASEHTSPLLAQLHPFTLGLTTPPPGGSRCSSSSGSGGT